MIPTQKIAMDKNSDPTPKCNVLVVEDNFINLELMKEMLDRLNCDVDIAENGFVALNQIKSKGYHLIFMDLHMPEMDGFETTRQIRNSEGEKNTPIIAITANVTPGIVNSCMEAGMDAYLSKPFRLEDLEGILDKYLPD